MKIKQEDIRRLSAAARQAGEDLFFVTGPCPDFAFLSGAFLFQEENTLLLLPGRFSMPRQWGGSLLTERFDWQTRFGFPVCRMKDGVIAADVRLLADQGFRAFCRDGRVTHLLIPFAELSDEIEYGFRSGYGWVAELRAELPYALRVTALFSASQADYRPWITRLGCPGCTVVDGASPLSCDSFEMADVWKKYAYTLDLALRRITHRVAVLFTDRREAEEFRRYCTNRGTGTFYLDGATDLTELNVVQEAFSRGEGPLIATKSILSSSLFFRADEAIYCGVPYSPAFMARCASFSADGTLACCFCQQDFMTDVKILHHFADRMPEGTGERFLSDAQARLSEVKKMICDAD